MKSPPLTNTQQLISDECKTIEQILLDKNRKYGDSALNPVRIFSKASAEEQLNVRLDDKLSRIASGQADDTEDPELDLIGYLILKRVRRQKNKLERSLVPRAATLPMVIGHAHILDGLRKELEKKHDIPKANGLQFPSRFPGFPGAKLPVFYLH